MRFRLYPWRVLYLLTVAVAAFVVCGPMAVLFVVLATIDLEAV